MTHHYSKHWYYNPTINQCSGIILWIHHEQVENNQNNSICYSIYENCQQADQQVSADWAGLL